MAKAVVMPKVGISVESCLLTEWLKKPGDTVAVGEAIFSIETDKAAIECESTEAGTVLELFFQVGDEVPVMVNVCAVGTPGEDVSALRPGGAAGGSMEPEELADAPAHAPGKAEVPVPGKPETPASSIGAISPIMPKTVTATPASPAATALPNTPDGLLPISPRAKALAQSLGTDPRSASPSGPYGRIIERDIRALAEQGQAATGAAMGAVLGAQPGSFSGTGIGGRVSVQDLANPILAVTAQGFATNATVSGASVANDDDYEDVPFTTIRKVIARGMSESLRTIPQLTHHFSFNAADIMAYRAKLKASPEALGLSGITLGDMVMFAVSRLLLKYPALNAHMVNDNTVRQFSGVHLGFACDTERGLMVPVIRSANRKSLLEVSREVKELAGKAQSGNLSPDAMAGATFTVSNLGSFGVESFTPVINPPQTGILGVGTIVQRPYEKDGQIRLYPAMGLSLTYDHRAIDGAPASRFVQELCRLLESFSLMLAK